MNRSKTEFMRLQNVMISVPEKRIMNRSIIEDFYMSIMLSVICFVIMFYGYF